MISDQRPLAISDFITSANRLSHLLPIAKQNRLSHLHPVAKQNKLSHNKTKQNKTEQIVTQHNRLSHLLPVAKQKLCNLQGRTIHCKTSLYTKARTIIDYLITSGCVRHNPFLWCAQVCLDSHSKHLSCQGVKMRGRMNRVNEITVKKYYL